MPGLLRIARLFLDTHRDRGCDGFLVYLDLRISLFECPQIVLRTTLNLCEVLVEQKRNCDAGTRVLNTEPCRARLQKRERDGSVAHRRHQHHRHHVAW